MGSHLVHRHQNLLANSRQNTRPLTLLFWVRNLAIFVRIVRPRLKRFPTDSKSLPFPRYAVNVLSITLGLQNSKNKSCCISLRIIGLLQGACAAEFLQLTAFIPIFKSTLIKSMSYVLFLEKLYKSRGRLWRRVGQKKTASPKRQEMRFGLYDDFVTHHRSWMQYYRHDLSSWCGRIHRVVCRCVRKYVPRSSHVVLAISLPVNVLRYNHLRR